MSQVEDRTVFCEFIVNRICEEVLLTEEKVQRFTKRLMCLLQQGHNNFFFFWDEGEAEVITLRGERDEVQDKEGIMVQYSPLRLIGISSKKDKVNR